MTGAAKRNNAPHQLKEVFVTGNNILHLQGGSADVPVMPTPGQDSVRRSDVHYMGNQMTLTHCTGEV